MIYETLSKIDNILGRIRTHPEYSSVVTLQYLDYLKCEADKHSCSMEKEESLNENIRDYKGCKKECYSRINDARNFLRENGISISSLSQLGKIIENSKNDLKGFRKRDVQFGGFGAPDQKKIPYLIKDLVDFLNKDINFHPVTRASESHLRLIQIHPYEDGNGRAARVLQSFCLNQRGYPTAIILNSEKEHYLGILKEVLGDRYTHKSSIYNQSNSEKLFHTFIASKVLESVENLEEKLIEKRIYEITFPKMEKEIGITFKKSLHSLGKRKNNHLDISQIKKNKGNKTFRIMGNISLDEIENFLKKRTNGYFKNYTIKKIIY